MSKKFLSPIKLAQGTSNPATGSSGELFFNTIDLKVYAHNGTTWLPSGGGVTVSATAPSSPVAGDCWYDSVDGTLYVRYDDGDSVQWVEVAANSGISVALSGRLGVVETYVTTLQSEMDTAQADIDAVEARATSLETSVRSVALGGTGASSHTSGAYLKGAGTSAITSQVGIPAGDITSGQLAAARMPSGSVLQVVQTNFITRSSQSYSNSTVTDITGLSASITPQSTNSRIMAFVRWFGELSPTDAVYNTVFGLKRSGTRIGEGTDNGSTAVTAISAPALSYEGSDASSTVETMSFFYLDSPASTASLTYQVFFIANVGAGSGVIAHNKAYNWSGQSVGFELGTSNITLMEVA